MAATSQSEATPAFALLLRTDGGRQFAFRIFRLYSDRRLDLRCGGFSIRRIAYAQAGRFEGFFLAPQKEPRGVRGDFLPPERNRNRKGMVSTFKSQVSRQTLELREIRHHAMIIPNEATPQTDES